jgi:hypothetical protein
MEVRIRLLTWNPLWLAISTKTSLRSAPARLEAAAQSVSHMKSLPHREASARSPCSESGSGATKAKLFQTWVNAASTCGKVFTGA